MADADAMREDAAPLSGSYCFSPAAAATATACLATTTAVAETTACGSSFSSAAAADVISAVAAVVAADAAAASAKETLLNVSFTDREERAYRSSFFTLSILFILSIAS